MAVGLQAACLSSNTTPGSELDWTRPGRAHLVGIGGCGMRALARVLDGRGWSLSGSDLLTAELADVLPRETLLLEGHSAAGLPRDADVVVHSDAVDGENPELLAARTYGIPTLSYFDVVGQLMEGAHGLAVAGTHGKSTTTAIAAWILVHASRDPTVLCGAATRGRADGGRAGRGSIVLAEACEYRANFLKLRPAHAVILGVEPDHFDCYPNLADARRAFARFAANIPRDGLLLARADCTSTRRAIANASCRVETFGLVDSQATDDTRQKTLLGTPAVARFKPAVAPHDWSARLVDERRGCYRFELVHHGEALCTIEFPMAGRHNVLNALAAAALAWHQGVEPERIAGALRRFPGVGRRLEPVGTWRGVAVIDDYAHHPTELTATLKAVRQMYPDRRVCCVFQPHQVSRTTHLLDELAESLHNGLRRRADRLWIAEIFRAREGPLLPGEVTAADLAARVRRRGHAVAGVHRIDRIGRDLRDHHLASGDVLLVIGAGDVRRVLPPRLEKSQR